MKRMLAMMMVFVFLSAAALGASAAEAKGEGGSKGLTRNVLETFRPPSGQEQQSIAKQLALSADQKTQMGEVNSRARKETEHLRQKYQAGYKNVVMLMNQEHPDKGRVNQTLKEFHQVHSQVLEAEVRYWMDLKTILTPEQNNKLWKMFEKSRIR